MRVDVRPSAPYTFFDVRCILHDLSEQSQIEADALGFDQKMLKVLAEDRANRPDTVTFVLDGRPSALLGWDKEGSAWYSFLLAGSAFYQPRPEPTLAGRRHLRQLQQLHSAVRFRSISLSDTDTFRRWMTCLGFVKLVRPPGQMVEMWEFSG